MTKVHTRDGTKLYVKDWGEGRPVILMHGWPLSSDSFDDAAKAIADAGMRAIFYDRRGFGRSDQPFNGYDYDTFADDLADVMEAKGVTENSALVGFSMGGGEVARYMSRHGGKGVTQGIFLFLSLDERLLAQRTSVLQDRDLVVLGGELDISLVG